MATEKVTPEEKRELKRKPYREAAAQAAGTTLSTAGTLVKHEGLRVIVIFEGRDAAGKGGTIEGAYRTRQPPRLSRRGVTGANRAGEDGHDTSSATWRTSRARARS